MNTIQNLPVASVGAGLSNAESNKKYSKIQESIENSISLDGKAKISRIQCEIKHLSDVEKLLLYLKLPTGVAQDEHLRLTPPSCLHTANRKEQAEAFTWIRSHLEEHGDVCMPKAEVYDEYRQYCDNHELRPLCNADFGKMMKQVFPDINTRRLGQRGQSKYFYGGLRKKTEHAPPSLPELEIHTKTLEMDTSSLDNEIFKASCLLICEWADKLLDSKFNSVQSIAEHLVTNLYVNTKSVAAFTLIAAMQENGNNLKGSALFNSQPSTGGDKHKETNLLLQQKLQKNKLMQKQKEKLQSMKEEIEQQHGAQSQSSQDRKTPNTPSRKSATPSRKTPRLPSPSPSPVLLQSPRKPQTKHEHGTAVHKNQGKPSPGIPTMQHSQISVEKIADRPIMQQTLYKTSAVENMSGSRLEQRVENVKRENPTSILSVQDHRKKEESVFTFDVAQCQETERMKKKGARSRTISEDITTDSDVEMIDLSSPLSKTEEVDTEAQTPFSEMETQSSTSHIRKINFDGVLEQQAVSVPGDFVNSSVANNTNKLSVGDSSDIDKDSKASDKLSKSDGHVSLKMLLERKDGDKGLLNKSLGVLEKSKNTLYVNPSTVSGRSAFVPFSQVQNRKENIVVNQTVSSSIPIFIPTTTIDQSTSVSMIAVPSNVVSRTQDQDQSRVPENLIKILPSSAAFQFKQSGAESMSQNIFIPSSQSSSLITYDPSSTEFSACLTKDTATLVTSSSLLSKSSSCDSIVSLSPSVTSNASTVAKHARTRFTPIRPKASPNKTIPAKDSKGDNPAYDKRPVSEILKEKRAKEQAEAIARLQVGVQLPTIPVQSSLAISRSSLSQFQSVASNVSPKEVVIIVNNQAGSTSVQTMMAPSMFVTKSLVCPEIQSQSAEGSKKAQETFGSQSDNSNYAKRLVSSQMGRNCEVRSSSVSESGESSKMVIEEQQEEAVTDSKQTNDNIPLGAEQDKESEHLDKVEIMWNETPPKLAKLNITSPYRPESACSLGRDTPVKIMKTSDSCSSRPESACSFGRETPSGARKRKSSDLDRRRDFKRLNSTGDEGDDILNMKLHIDALSPENEARMNQNVRRTRSCTYELDKDVRVSYAALLTDCSQSPDISSLEREALIESGFPHSVCSGNLHKVHTQSSSIGVNAKALRHSQQKLMKNKTDLDQRVKNFLQKDESMAPSGNINIEKIQRPRTSQDNLVTKDCVSGMKKVSDLGNFRHGTLQRSKSGIGNPRLDIEPSGLPSDVADWINEAIEKRQIQNPSVMSEPELTALTNKTNPASDVNIADFKFEVGRAASRNIDVPASTPSCTKSSEVEKQQETTFMVPKVPALNFRVKENSARPGAEVQGKSPRCQSLPSFGSSNQSAVSPVTSPVSRVGLYRATSMSPRTQPPESAQSDAMSPVQRNEVRENHPLGLSIHAGSKFREDASLKHAGRHGSFEDGRPGHGQTGSYLASMQHTLQKPVDSMMDQSGTKTRDITVDTFTTLTSPQLAGQSPHLTGQSPHLTGQSSQLTGQSPILTGQSPLLTGQSPHLTGQSPQLIGQSPQLTGQSPHLTGPSPQLIGQSPQMVRQSPQMAVPISVNKSPFCRDVTVPVDRNLSQIPERYVSQTPFSDSGYHSTGASPVLNSTPVGALMDLEVGNMQYNIQHADITDQPVGVTPQSPSQYQGASSQSGMSAVLQTEPLTTSANSAFVPIQSLSQDSRYVTPIKPTVTLPNSGGNFDNSSSYSTNLFVDLNQSDLANEAMVVSPQDIDPPSYETAIRTLRKGLQDGGNITTQSSDNLQGAGSSIQPSSYNSTPGNLLQDLFQPQKDVSTKEASSQERVSLLANMGNTVENDGKQGIYGPFASKLVQLSRQTQQRPFAQQKPVSSDQTTIPSALPQSEQISQGSRLQCQSSSRTMAMESRSLLNSKSESAVINIPANTMMEPSAFGAHNVNLSEPLISNMQSDLPGNRILPDGAITSSQYQNSSDLDFIPTSHFSATSSESFLKTNPSHTIKDHCIEDNISHQSMYSQFNSVLQTESNSTIERQDMLNFPSDIADNPEFRDPRFEGISIGDEGIKNLAGTKDMCGSESEFADISLTLETLKELDSQYLSGNSDMYGRDTETVQQLDEFPMFED